MEKISGACGLNDCPAKTENIAAMDLGCCLPSSITKSHHHSLQVVAADGELHRPASISTYITTRHRWRPALAIDSSYDAPSMIDLRSAIFSARTLFMAHEPQISGRNSYSQFPLSHKRSKTTEIEFIRCMLRLQISSLVAKP